MGNECSKRNTTLDDASYKLMRDSKKAKRGNIKGEKLVDLPNPKGQQSVFTKA
jgi:hypothetical protein